MRKISQVFYKRMFIAATIWNVAFVFIGFVFYEFWFGLVISPKIDPNNFYYHFMFNLILIFILTFGFGYYLVSRDLTKNKGIVLIAAIGKPIVLSVFAYGYFTNKITFFGFANLCGDFIWAVLFFIFLWQARNFENENSLLI